MSGLKRTLGPIMLWGLGVGYVISGEYFGWNLGLPVGGTYGMLLATFLVTILYLTFVLSYTELACALPHAGGAFVYADRALGPYPGFLAGLVQILEFVFAPPAIAMAIAAYVAQRYPSFDPRVVAIAAYGAFTGLNAWGVRQAAIFELVVTILAVAELLIFTAVAAPHFSLEAFTRDPLPHGWAGTIGCIPFAIWFYLALEGVANAAEEAKDPHKDIVIGFTSAIGTLVVLTILVFFSAIGVGGWAAVVYPPGSTTESDAPLPLALAQVVPADSGLYLMLLGIGLLGLIASFHGIILAAGRATMAFGQAGYAPSVLGRVHPRTGTPIPALLMNLGLGILAILSGRTAEIITLACFGAASLYVVSMVSVLVLRKKEPDLRRPYRAPFYPFFPVIALILGVLALLALAWSSPKIAGWFLAMVGIGSVYYLWIQKSRSPTQRPPSGAP
ncbi:MAG: ethanolamine permease [Deltaproteobacteria bacterium]|jgi:ethanolamine permease|nr:ethanolamine permease [Deltaproteobacteria bacterium]